MSEELERLGLSANVRKALVAAGLDTVEKLVEYKIDNPFSAIANIGDAGQAEIETAIAATAAPATSTAENGQAGGGSAVAAGDNSTDAANRRETLPPPEADAGGKPPADAVLLDPNEPNISPGERGRRLDKIRRAAARAEPQTDVVPGGPIVDEMTDAGFVVARKTAFVRGGQTFTPIDNENGETVIAEIELFGECSYHYFTDSLAGGSAYVDDVSQNEVDGKGERISPADYVVRLRNPGRVGNSPRARGHILAKLRIPNYRIPAAEIVALLRNRTAVFESAKKGGARNK